MELILGGTAIPRSDLVLVFCNITITSCLALHTETSQMSLAMSHVYLQIGFLYFYINQGTISFSHTRFN